MKSVMSEMHPRTYCDFCLINSSRKTQEKETLRNKNAGMARFSLR